MNVLAVINDFLLKTDWNFVMLIWLFFMTLVLIGIYKQLNDTFSDFVDSDTKMASFWNEWMVDVTTILDMVEDELKIIKKNIKKDGMITRKRLETEAKEIKGKLPRKAKKHI